MAMVGVASGSLWADSQPRSFGLGWGSAAAWRRSTFIIWTGWTLAVVLLRWQHHKHYHPYYYYYYFFNFKNFLTLGRCSLLLLLLLFHLCGRSSLLTIASILCLFLTIMFWSWSFELCYIEPRQYWDLSIWDGWQITHCLRVNKQFVCN